MPDDLRQRLETRVGWLELFFDLVVIAGIGLLSHGLHAEESPAGLGMYVLLYCAIWLTWVSVVLYTDVAGPSTRTRTVLVAMFLVAVMAASAPIHEAQRANVFAVAFLLTRGFVGQEALRTGRVVASWPLLQLSGLSLPWLVSLWVAEPWKYLLWACALVLEFALVILRGGSIATERFVERSQRVSRRRASRRGGSSRWSSDSLTVVGVDREHLEERLGVFLIIVFGEAVTQLLAAAATHDWTRPFIGVVIAAFFCLVGLWSLAFSYGFAAAPHTRLAAVSPRFGLPMHLLSTLGILLFAAGLGAMAAAPGEPLPTVMRWVLAGGLGLNFAVSAVSGLTGGAPRRWLLSVAIPTTAYAIALAVFGGPLGDQWLAWLCLVPIAWQVLNANRAALMERFGLTPDLSPEDFRARAEALRRAQRAQHEQHGRGRRGGGRPDPP